MDSSDPTRGVGAGGTMVGQIMAGVRYAQLPLELDTITPADGNCFSKGIWSQCQRPDVAPMLPANFKDYRDLKQKLHNFIMKTQLRVVTEMKERYVRDVQPAAREELGGKEETWDGYWKRMLGDKEWSDGIYIQGMAYFLQMDIVLVMSRATPDRPYTIVSGSWDSPDGPTHGGPLILGYLEGRHFQSLLPLQPIQSRIHTTMTVEQMFNEERCRRMMQKTKPATMAELLEAYNAAYIEICETDAKRKASMTEKETAELIQKTLEDIKNDPTMVSPTTRAEYKEVFKAVCREQAGKAKKKGVLAKVADVFKPDDVLRAKGQAEKCLVIIIIIFSS